MQLISFENCCVTYREETLFDPSWGVFDMAIGSTITSVFGGPADRKSYGDFEEFQVLHVPERHPTDYQQGVYDLYQRIRKLRSEFSKSSFDGLVDVYFAKFNNEWLPAMELLELSYLFSETSWVPKLLDHLQSLVKDNSHLAETIQSGIEIAELQI